ncbi:MAG: SpoIIE family protein phosphatase [Bacteroidetes bacterium]|nr:SpoIIE family protein phosphatase [Bacteroidota bacterium]
MEDKNGLLWLATAENGVISYNQKAVKTTVYKKIGDDGNSINDNLVLSLLEDKSGLIWCGTWQGGVNIFDPRKQLMEHYYYSSSEQGSLINNTVWGISKSRTNKPWIATSGGICSFDPNTHKFTKLEYTEFDPNTPAEQTIIQSVLEDIDGQIWLGSNGSGVFRYNPLTKKYRHYRYKDEPGFITNDFSGLSGNTVTELLLCKNEDLWIIPTGGGLNLFQRNQDKFKYFLNDENDAESISSNSISTIIESKEGEIWVATTNAGLNLLNPITGKCKRFKHDPENPNSLSDNKLTSLHIDNLGILWIGTKSGLCCYIEGEEKFVSFTEKDGLPNNNIRSIENDDAGNLWLSTNKGICVFNPATRKVKSYDVNDGVQSNEFKVNSSFKANDGYIYFGGVKGMNRFNPRLLSDNPNPPNLVITGFSVLNKPYMLKEDILITKEIKLSYKDYFFSFDFAGLEYTNSAKNKYKYILEGFNEEWINIGTTRSLTFTNLDPGEYTLRIQACNNDGVWSSNSEGIRITITPPFWKTKWFFASCILIIIFCIYSYIKFREKKLTKEKVVLENKVEIRTKELKEEKIKVEEAHKEITDSIHYAKRIQRALLASDILLKKNLPEYFVLYKPKDIVSGDFYWAYKVDANNMSENVKQVRATSVKFLIAAGDCTGHGVPGAFMSLLNISKLSETVNEKKIIGPDLILDHVRGEIIKALNPEGAEVESKDGMDCVLCAFDFNTMELEFAAANNPLWLIRNNELIEYKPDKIPVGIYHGELKPFSLQTIHLLKNDIVYLFTDGYADQFGGEKGKKFKYQQLKELLLSNAHLSMQEQKKVLDDTIEKWKGNLEQVDDILIIGIKI